MSKTLDNISQDTLNTVEGSLGCAVVDVSSGLTLSVAHM